MFENKPGQEAQGQSQCRTGLGQVWSRTGRLWFGVGQRHVWQNPDVWRTDLGQVDKLSKKIEILSANR